MVKKGKTKKLFYLSVISLIILLTGFLLVSGLNFKTSSRINLSGCSTPIIISSDSLPQEIYDANILYSKLIRNGNTISYEQDKIYVWNIGPDHKPNTADDLNPVQINATGIILTKLTGIDEDYGDLSPKINNRYIVWASNYRGVGYNIKYVDMGVDGILDQNEASNIIQIYSIPYAEMEINSVSLKRNKVSFTYNTKLISINQYPPKISFCDLNLTYGQSGACFQNSVITFDSGAYNYSKMTGNSYAYNNPNSGTEVIFGEITYSSPRDIYDLVSYSIFSWNQNSGINLISNETELVDSHEFLGLAIVSYQDKIYEYFYPGNIPGNLFQLSTGRSIAQYVKANSRGSFSPNGNYLIAYTKAIGGIEGLYLASFRGSGNQVEIQTPFRYSYRPFLDSSSSGNHIYTYQNNSIYYTQCFGI